MIVSFSGIDSAGKTTQIDLLYNYCIKKDIKVLKKWSKARGTPGVLFLKELYRNDKRMDEKLKMEYRDTIYGNSVKLKLLFIASMIDLIWYWGIYFRILGYAKKILICDRYIWDTNVEMLSDFKGIDIEKKLLWRIVKTVTPKPKHSFLFLIPPEVSVQRDIQKKAAGIEEMDLKKEKIKNYLMLRDMKKWNHIVDGLGSIETIFEEIKTTIGI